ncbi:MAG: lipopolysaccharide heptosyltransferase II [Ignavibacteriales bacterium]|nr:lipopolysaccharide heptosyltransferase II [Ignavibacteriales bacterium]
MATPQRFLVIQTAFIGDVILTLPMIQELKRHVPSAHIDLIVIPRSADLLRNHPSIREVIQFDKQKSDKGVFRLWRIAQMLRSKKYDAALIPHRSMRSAALAFLAGVPMRVGFDVSVSRFAYTHVVRYDKLKHEADRNAALLAPFGINLQTKVLPTLHPTNSDVEAVNLVVKKFGWDSTANVIAVAPGTVWNTKRWPKEKFIELVRLLLTKGLRIVMVGGAEDVELCGQIVQASESESVRAVAGQLGLLESAALIQQCSVVISNDSAPMHMAMAMRTPVVAIFGATVPEFGFSPYGVKDVVIETKGLACRPCSMHGGKACPIGTFECMEKISPAEVCEAVVRIIRRR